MRIAVPKVDSVLSCRLVRLRNPPGLADGGGAGSLIVDSQQSDDLKDVSLAVERDCHPAGVGPPAVLLRGAGTDEPIAKGALERQVRTAVAVQVAGLAAVEADGDRAKALRACVHARPLTRFGDDRSA
jgi:hypothetical protein